MSQFIESTNIAPPSPTDYLHDANHHMFLNSPHTFEAVSLVETFQELIVIIYFTHNFDDYLPQQQCLWKFFGARYKSKQSLDYFSTPSITIIPHTQHCKSRCTLLILQNGIHVFSCIPQRTSTWIIPN